MAPIRGENTSLDPRRPEKPWYPQADSNRCFHLERVASWSPRRWGLRTTRGYQRQHTGSAHRVSTQGQHTGSPHTEGHTRLGASNAAEGSNRGGSVILERARKRVTTRRAALPGGAGQGVERPQLRSSGRPASLPAGARTSARRWRRRPQPSPGCRSERQAPPWAAVPPEPVRPAPAGRREPPAAVAPA